MRRWVVDAGIAAALAAAMVLVITTAQEPGARDPDRVAFLFGVAVAGLTFWRRRRPLLVLMASIAVLLVYYALDFPAFSPAVPLAVAAFAAADAGRTGAAAALLAGLLGLSVGYQVLAEGDSAVSVLGLQTLTDAALLAAMLSLGEAVRNRRAHREEVRLRLERAEADRRRDAAERVRAERLRIARDLHDVLAHTISALNVQAAVAADAMRDDPATTEAALEAIRSHSREAFAEVGATVALLRDGEAAPRTPAPGLDRLGELAERAAAADVAVTLDVARAAPLPAAVELTAFRIVQESLTNVVRHAGARRASVRVRRDEDALRVDVSDDGTAPVTDPPREGHGLVGMRERAAALGGELHAGPDPAGGFRVSARLPLTGAPG